MELSKYTWNFKFTFVAINILIIIAAVFCFIYGQFDFQSKFVHSGTFIGGHLAQLSIIFLVFSLLGIYSVIGGDRKALVLYFSLVLCSLCVRNFSAGLAQLHGHGWYASKTSPVFWGLYVWLELSSLFMSAFLLVHDKK